jgi:hypothetical protein
MKSLLSIGDKFEQQRFYCTVFYDILSPAMEYNNKQGNNACCYSHHAEGE